MARTVASVLQLNEDLAEVLALVHDIGHPPFAHAGEAELDRQMRRFGERFEHNLHALRIVEHFENSYARFPGLNLTFEVREGIVKHSRDYSPGEVPEADEYLPGVRPPLEAQLIDLVDEAAYHASDLDDGFEARLFTVDDARQAIPQFNRFFEEAEGQFPGASERVLFNEVLRSMVDWLITGLINGTLAFAEEAGVNDVEDVRGHARRIATFTPETQAAVRESKQFLFHFVYYSPGVIEERRRSSQAIGALFQHFMDHPEALPCEYRQFTSDLDPHRAVCDYIAGMTDGFLLRRCQALLE